MISADSLRLQILVTRIAGGDSTALSDLYEVSASHVFAIARGMLKCREDAEDVVCDVYVYVWQHAERFDATRGSLHAWLTVLTRSRAIDRIRRQRCERSATDEIRQELPAFESAAEPPEHWWAGIEQAGELRRALMSLAPLRRQVVSLAFLEGMTHEEIAANVCLPLGSVKSLIRRALLTLHAQLALPHDRMSRRGGSSSRL